MKNGENKLKIYLLRIRQSGSLTTAYSVPIAAAAAAAFTWNVLLLKRSLVFSSQKRKKITENPKCKEFGGHAFILIIFVLSGTQE